MPNLGAMRVRISESKALQAAIASAGIPATDIAFVKKRGYLHVQRQGHTDFIIHRKTPTALVDGEWTRSDVYFLGPAAAYKVESWQEVERHFSTWLSQG